LSGVTNIARLATKQAGALFYPNFFCYSHHWVALMPQMKFGL